MIFQKLFDIISVGYAFLLELIPSLPDIPDSLYNKVINIIDLIFDYGGDLLGLFVRISTLKIVLPLLILVINFDKIYEVILWIVKKIPVDIN